MNLESVNMRKPRRSPVRREERQGPTPQTALKAMPSVVPLLTPDQQWCIAQIAAAHALMIGTLGAPPHRRRPVADRLPDEIPGRQRRTDDERPLSQGKQRLLDAYTAWTRRLAEMRRPGCMAAVLAVAVDDKLPWQIDRDQRWPLGTTVEALLVGLEAYAGTVGLRGGMTAEDRARLVEFSTGRHRS